MKLGDLPTGQSVFIDANVFVYHFTRHPIFGADCTDFVKRIERGDAMGFASAHGLSETAHRLMTIEAAAANGWPFAGIARRLKKRPQKIQALAHFQQAIATVPKLGIQVLPVGAVDVENAALLSQTFGLLSGDALIAAMMKSYGITNLASYDADFDRVPWINRYDSI